MRNKNRYQRNQSFRNKYWNRVRSKSHPYETHMPYFCGDYSEPWSYENQIRDKFDWINKQARYMDSGCHKGIFHATSGFRRKENKMYNAKNNAIMKKINNGNYDAEFIPFKRSADWNYF